MYVIAETLAFVGAAIIAAAYWSDQDKRAAHEEPLPNKKESVYVDLQAVSAHDRVMPQYAGYIQAGTYKEKVGIRQLTTVHRNPTKEHQTNDPVFDAVRGDGRLRMSADDKQFTWRRLRDAGQLTHGEAYHKSAVAAALLQRHQRDTRSVHKVKPGFPQSTSVY